MLETQKAYLLTYCKEVKELLDGKPLLTENGKKELAERMHKYLGNSKLSFLIAHSADADAVASELTGIGK